MKIFLKKIAASENKKAHFVAGDEDSQSVLDKLENNSEHSTNLKVARDVSKHRRMFKMFKIILDSLPEDRIWETHGDFFSTMLPNDAIAKIRTKYNDEDTANYAGRIIFIKTVGDILKLCKFHNGMFERKLFPDGQIAIEFESIAFENLDQTKFDDIYPKFVNACLKYLLPPASNVAEEEYRKQLEEQIALNF